jgi:hypothetical protein
VSWPTASIFSQIFFHLLSGGEIANKPGEDAISSRLADLADCQLHGKDGSVLLLRLDRAADADDVLLARPLVAAKIAVMLGLVGLGHQHFDVLPDHFACRIAEELFRSLAEGLNDAALVDRNDRVGGGFHHGTEACFPFGEHGLRVPLLGDVEVEFDDGMGPAVQLGADPLARHNDRCAVPMALQQLTFPAPVAQKSGINGIERHWKSRLQKVVRSPADRLCR